MSGSEKRLKNFIVPQIMNRISVIGINKYSEIGN